MIDKTTFIKAISYLKSIYIDWNFELKNNEMIANWYDLFKNLDQDIFRFLIKEYINTNEYPPRSPLSLLKYLTTFYEKKELQINEAWNKALDLAHYSFTYNRKLIYDELEQYPVLKKTVEQYENELSNLKSGDYALRKQFENAYKENLTEYLEKKTRATISCQEVKLIENKK